MPWTDEKLRQVIAQYTPVLYLHNKERYFPCSVEWYFKRSQLWLVEPIEGQPKVHSPLTTTPCTPCQVYCSSYKCKVS